MMVTAHDRIVMKHRPVNRWLLMAGWCVTAIVTVAAVAFLYQTFATPAA